LDAVPSCVVADPNCPARVEIINSPVESSLTSVFSGFCGDPSRACSGRVGPVLKAIPLHASSRDSSVGDRSYPSPNGGGLLASRPTPRAEDHAFVTRGQHSRHILAAEMFGLPSTECIPLGACCASNAVFSSFVMNESSAVPTTPLFEPMNSYLCLDTRIIQPIPWS
jgi:hypothetical protein